MRAWRGSIEEIEVQVRREIVGRSLARMASFKVVLAGIVLNRNAWMDLTAYGLQAGRTALPQLFER